MNRLVPIVADRTPALVPADGVIVIIPFLGLIFSCAVWNCARKHRGKAAPKIISNEGSMGSFQPHWTAYVSGFGTPIVGLIAGYIAYQQYSTAKNKLRLDLYNRRFEIYASALEFYHALLVYRNAANFEATQNRFIKAYRESQFLFCKNSGVYCILDEMHTRSFHIIGFKERGHELRAHPQDFKDMSDKSQESLKWFNTNIIELEKRMDKYLNFHKIAG